MGRLSVSQDNCVIENEGDNTGEFLTEGKHLLSLGVGRGCYPWTLGRPSPALLEDFSLWSELSHFQNLNQTPCLSPQVISMVMVAVGVYARLMKHAGGL